MDHGREGFGEPVAGLLLPGNAGSNTAADDIEASRLALAQLPKTYRRGRRTLIRTDSGGGTHEILNSLTAQGRWLSYSVGMVIADAIHQAVLQVPASAWAPAIELDGEIRAARDTGMRNLPSTRPRGTGSGWRSFRSRSTCWPERPCSP